MAIGAFNRKVAKFTNWSLLVVGFLGGVMVGWFVLTQGIFRSPRLALASLSLFLIAGVSLYQIRKHRRIRHEKMVRRERLQSVAYGEFPRDKIRPPVHRMKRYPRH